MSSGLWAENPYNNHASLKQHALPKVLFNECHKNCVEDGFHPKNEADLSCISNCQAKTYQAFEMQMRVAYNFELKRSYRDYIDVSKYTGMEVEHGHNTAYQWEENSAGNLGHFDPHARSQNKYQSLKDEVNKNLRNLREFAN